MIKKTIFIFIAILLHYIIYLTIISIPYIKILSLQEKHSLETNFRDKKTISYYSDQIRDILETK